MIWTYLSQSYWRDEVFRVFMAKESLFRIIQLAPYDGQPPLYYFLLHFWLKIFGDSEIATRSLSLIFFELLIFLGFKFGERLFPKTRFGFLVSLFLLVNPLLIFYAFEARMYMLFIFLVTWSYYCLWTKKWKLWIFSSLLGLYTHNFMVFVLVSQLVYLFANKQLTKKIWQYLLFIFLLYLPWIPILEQQIRLIESDFWTAPLNFKSVVLGLSGVLTGYEGDPASLIPFFIKLSLFLLIFVILAKAVHKKAWWFLILWLVLPAIFVFLLSYFGRSLFLSRYLSFLSVPLVLLLALSVHQKNIWWKTASFLVLVGLFLYLNQLLFPYRMKNDIHMVASDIATVAKPKDMILTHSLNFFEMEYYFAKFAKDDYTRNIPIKIYTPTGYIPYFVGKVLIPDENVTSQIPQDRRVFVVEKTGRLTIHLPVF